MDMARAEGAGLFVTWVPDADAVPPVIAYGTLGCMAISGERNQAVGSSSAVPSARGRLPLPLLTAVWVLLALVAVGVLVTVTVGWGHDAWKGSEAEGNVKTVQAIVLGLGFLGVVAGAVVTYRRQQTMQDQLDDDRRKYQLELDKFALEQTKYAEEQVREMERGRQERYAQGAQMLADESPAVRIAGLNVIAALGREADPEDELRQTCVNLICAYVREASPVSAVDRESGQIGETRYENVTVEACRLLPSLFPAASSCHVVDLDLRDCRLGSLRMVNKGIGSALFDRAHFVGRVRFKGSRFTGRVRFRDSIFHSSAGFGGAEFLADVGFGRSRFRSIAWFDGVIFSGRVWFDETVFESDGLFDGARFLQYSDCHDDDLNQARFANGQAPFQGAGFEAKDHATGSASSSDSC